MQNFIQITTFFAIWIAALSIVQPSRLQSQASISESSEGAESLFEPDESSLASSGRVVQNHDVLPQSVIKQHKKAVERNNESYMLSRMFRDTSLDSEDKNDGADKGLGFANSGMFMSSVIKNKGKIDKYNENRRKKQYRDASSSSVF